jgi:hypothetical protein
MKSSGYERGSLRGCGNLRWALHPCNRDLNEKTVCDRLFGPPSFHRVKFYCEECTWHLINSLVRRFAYPRLQSTPTRCGTSWTVLSLFIHFSR